MTFDPLNAAGTTNNSPSSDWSNKERINITPDYRRRFFLLIYVIALNNTIEIKVRPCSVFFRNLYKITLFLTREIV